MLDKSLEGRYIPGMSTDFTDNLPFMKMHGLGNDFVVVDARAQKREITARMAQGIGHRQFGVGFDQLAVITQGTEDAHLTFYNTDGSGSAACGNATRCIARYLMTELQKPDLTLTTEHGTLPAKDLGGGITSVNMGHPQTVWADIPLAHEIDTLQLPIDGNPTATGMGNPHCTFFVEDAEAIDLQTFGPTIEHHPLFPERTNVQVAHLLGPDHIRMRVWERGVGITLASGSSSCATAVTAVRRGLTSHKVRIDLDGGTLQIEWRDDGVWMSGPTAHVFSGVLTPEFMASIV